MELKSGYKQSEVGIIPEDWEVKPLGAEIEKLVSGVSVNSVDEELGDHGHDKYILKTSAVSKGRFFPMESKKIAPKDLQRARLNPKADTIIVSRMNTPDLVGECGYIERNYKDLFIPDRLWMTAISKQSKLCVQWLSYVLSSRSYKLKIKDMATGTSGSMKNISQVTFLSLLVAFPQSEEQRVIAAALRDVDALIQALDALIAKKRDFKLAARSQLLRPKKGWNKFNLGDLASFHKGKGLPKSEIDSHGSEFCIHYGELFLNYPEKISTVQSKTNLNVGVFHSLSNDVLMPTSDVTPNGLAVASCIQQDDIILGGDILVIRTDKNKVNGEFLSHSIRSQKDQIMQLVTGTTVYHLYSADMKRFTFWMPELEEQIAIADILSDINAELTALEAKRDKTRELKRGMMQELLTGRTRLMPTNSNSFT